MVEQAGDAAKSKTWNPALVFLKAFGQLWFHWFHKKTSTRLGTFWTLTFRPMNAATKNAPASRGVRYSLER